MMTMPTDNSISSLRAGDEVRGVFACVRKDRLKARTGASYLALELRDRTGSVPARVFRNADLLAGRFDRGDLVAIVGQVERFREELVIEVSDIRRARLGSEAETQATLTEFLPSTYRDMEELDGFIEHLGREVYDPGYRALIDMMLADEQLREALRRTPCTRNGHHAYLGGLLEHTVAVTTLARETCDLHPRLNSDLLLTAAIVHDIGRIREFTYGAEIGLTEAGKLLGHLLLGEQMLQEYFARLAQLPEGALPESSRLALSHCLLCHHGAGSAPGGRFGSPEALALYRLNALDAGVKGALEHGLYPPAGG
jgi:3'-5' exoribonuclease